MYRSTSLPKIGRVHEEEYLVILFKMNCVKMFRKYHVFVLCLLRCNMSWLKSFNVMYNFQQYVGNSGLVTA